MISSLDSTPAPGSGVWAPPPSPVGPGLVAEILVAGAHGGAGATTLAALLRPALDVGAPRTRSACPPLRAAGRPVVVVARNTATAAGRTVTVINAISAGGVRVAVLAVVGDGLPERPDARYRFRLLEARVGGLVRVPYVPALRDASDPCQVRLPRRAQRALLAIRQLTGTSVPVKRLSP